MKTTSLFRNGAALFVIAVLGSCSTPSASGPLMQFDLAGFPDDDARYNVVVNTFDGQNKLLDNFELGTADGSIHLTQSHTVSVSTATVAIGLFDGGQSPWYFATIPLTQQNSQTSNTISVRFWLNNSAWSALGQIQYGFSTYLAQPLAVGASKDLTFTDQPYYLFQLPVSAGHTYDTTFSILSGSVSSRVGSTARSVVLGSGPPPLDTGTASVAGTKYALIYPDDYGTPSEATLVATDVTP